MTGCKNWFSENGDQWCEATVDRCACDGNEHNCPLKDKNVAAAMHEEEQTTLELASLRVRRCARREAS